MIHAWWMLVATLVIALIWWALCKGGGTHDQG